MPPWNVDRCHQRPTKFLQRRRSRLVASGLGLVTVLLQYKLVLASPIAQHSSWLASYAHVLLFCTTTSYIGTIPFRRFRSFRLLVLSSLSDYECGFSRKPVALLPFRNVTRSKSDRRADGWVV